MRLRAALLALALLLPAVPVTPVAAQSADVVNVISHVAHVYGVPVERMVCVARLESTFRPWVTSAAGHRGLWQWSDGTWAWASVQAGYPDTSPYDLVASSYVAGWLMAQGGWAHWSVSPFC